LSLNFFQVATATASQGLVCCARSTACTRPLALAGRPLSGGGVLLVLLWALIVGSIYPAVRRYSSTA